jgi:phosphate uptake regulator
MTDTPQEYREFAELVLEMLDTQRSYFRTRDPETLATSKRLEKDVRRQAIELQTGRDRTGQLFE